MKNGCHVKRLYPDSHTWGSYGCFVDSTQCKEGGWTSTLSENKNGTPGARFFSKKNDNSCTEKAPVPRALDRNQGLQIMRRFIQSPWRHLVLSQIPQNHTIYGDYSNDPGQPEVLGDGVISLGLSHNRPRTFEMSSLVYRNTQSTRNQDVWGPEYLFEFAIQEAKRHNSRRLIWSTPNPGMIKVYYEWCAHAGYTLKHNTSDDGVLQCIRDLLEITLFYKNGASITYTLDVAERAYTLDDKIIDVNNLIGMVQTELSHSNLIACYPTSDEVGGFTDLQGNRVNHIWIDL